MMYPAFNRNERRPTTVHKVKPPSKISDDIKGTKKDNDDQEERQLPISKPKIKVVSTTAAADRRRPSILKASVTDVNSVAPYAGMAHSRAIVPEPEPGVNNYDCKKPSLSPPPQVQITKGNHHQSTNDGVTLKPPKRIFSVLQTASENHHHHRCNLKNTTEIEYHSKPQLESEPQKAKEPVDVEAQNECRKKSLPLSKDEDTIKPCRHKDHHHHNNHHDHQDQQEPRRHSRDDDDDDDGASGCDLRRRSEADERRHSGREEKCHNHHHRHNDSGRRRSSSPDCDDCHDEKSSTASATAAACKLPPKHHRHEVVIKPKCKHQQKYVSPYNAKMLVKDHACQHQKTKDKEPMCWTRKQHGKTLQKCSTKKDKDHHDDDGEEETNKCGHKNKECHHHQSDCSSVDDNDRNSHSSSNSSYLEFIRSGRRNSHGKK